MDRKTTLELISVIFVLASIVILTLTVYSAETDPNVRLLAIGIILSAFLGGYNMFKSLFRSAEAEELKKANRLKEQEMKSAKKQKEAGRVIKMIENFMNPLIKDLERIIREIDNALNDERFGLTKTEIQPNYGFIYGGIVDNKEDPWIRRKVDEYNNFIKSIKDTKPMFEEAIEQSIKQKFPDSIGILKEDMGFLVFSIANNDRTLANNTEGAYGFWNEHIDELLEIRNEGELLDMANKIKQCLSKAKKVATELKDRLEELKGQYMEKCDVWEPEIEIEKGGKRVAVIQK